MSVDPVETDAQAGAPGKTRRRVLAAAGAAGAAALLAACGSETPAEGQTGTGSGGEEGDRPEGAIVAVDQVPVGGGFIDPDRGVVVTRPAEDQWRAFSATCTHASCLVSSVSSSGIVCTCHGSTFSTTDGSVVGGPAPAPLPAKEVAVADGWVVSA